MVCELFFFRECIKRACHRFATFFCGLAMAFFAQFLPILVFSKIRRVVCMMGPTHYKV